MLAQAMADLYVGKMHPRTAYALTQIAGPLLESMADTDLEHRVERLEADQQSEDEQGHDEEGGVEQRQQAVVAEPLSPRAEAGRPDPRSG